MSDISVVKSSQLVPATQTVLEAAKLITNGELSTMEELAEKLELDPVSVTKLVNDPDFIRLTKTMSMSKSFLSYHAIGLNKLLQLIEQSDDPKTFLSSIQLLAKMLKEISPDNPSVNVNINLEQLISQSDNLIRKSNYIDAEEIR